MLLPDAELVLAERQGHVLLLTLNRPERLNAWTDALEDRYFDLLDEADSDPDVRAVVVTGAGRGFCAGADLDDLTRAASIGSGNEIDLAKFVERERPRHRPLLLGKPLLAAVNGAAAGLGLVEALYCDLRFTTPDAKFTAAFSRRGLIAEYGVSWLLSQLVGPSKAFDLLVSARVVAGVEAFGMGLADRVVEPDSLLDTTMEYAQELATFCSPSSMLAIKQQLGRARTSTFLESVGYANRLMLESLRHPDFAEGIASYLEGRSPSFQQASRDSYGLMVR